MVAWLVVGSILGAAVAPLDAAQIFRSARAYVTAVHVAPYVVCTMQDESFVEYDGRRAPVEERFRVAIRTSDGHAFVETQRLRHGYQGRMPPVVVGDNAIFPNTGFYRLGDLPTSTFGLRPAEPAPEDRDARPKPPESADSTSGGLRVIGRVSNADIPYRLARLADATIDGRSMYHLALAPSRAPTVNVIREMWVDATTFEPRRYVVERFVLSPPLFSYIVTIDNTNFLGVPINTLMTGSYDPQSVGHAGRSGTIQVTPNRYVIDVAFDIGDVSFPATLPDWMFDPDAFRDPARDALPAALDAVDIPPDLPTIRHLAFSTETTAPASVAPVAHTLVLDVVAATADGGLVVDVLRTGAHTTPESQPPIRIAIGPDGSLGYDGRLTLPPDEIALLHLLGRRVVGSTMRTAGDAWTTRDLDTAGISQTRYEVAAMTAPDRETLAIDAVITPSNRTASVERTSGTVVYDSKHLVPVDASFTTSPAGGSGRDVERTVVRLEDDSFSSL